MLKFSVQVRDKNGKLATDIIPRAFPSSYDIEARLRLSGIKSLPRLDQTAHDDRSLEVHRDYAQEQQDELMDESSVVSDLAEDLGWDFDPVDIEMEHENEEQGERKMAGGGGIGSEAEGRQLEERSHVSDVSSNTFQSMAAFTHDTDNLHAEGLHNLTDAHSIQTAQPLQQEIALITALFQETRDRIRVWLDAAQKEADLMRMVPCPLNCDTMCKIETLTFHVRDDCPFRSLQCPLCHKMVRFIDLKQHNLKLCQKRPISCPNAYQGCCERITPDTVEAHVMLKCKLRKMACRQFCGAFIPYCKREEHELHHCKQRAIQCDQCKAGMVASTYTAHLHEHCPERVIKCRISCGRSFKAREIDAHEHDECVRPCKWHCGQRIGPPEQLALHETNLCPDKPMQCKHSCGVSQLTKKDVHVHERDLCIRRPLLCTRGCGLTLPASEHTSHLEAFCGNCAERPVRCPSNLIGWRIMLLPEQQEGIVLQYRRHTITVDAITGAPVTEAALIMQPSQLNDANTIETESNAVAAGQTTKQIQEDQIFLRTDSRQEWVPYWATKYVLLRRVQGDHLAKHEHIDHKFPCGWIVHSDLDNHLVHHCLNREIHVAGENDRQVQFVGQKTKFADAIATAEKRLKFDHFVQTQVVQKSTEFCGFCSAEIDSLSMPAHHREDCLEYLVKCPYICGNEVRRRELEHHVAETCPKRLVLCLDCNSKDLWAEELSTHQLHQCDMRLVPCPLQCGEQQVRLYYY